MARLLLPIGAEDGIRTRDLLLGKEMLYQLSHSRKHVDIVTIPTALVKLC